MRKRKCQNCKQWYMPDYRNRYHQRYCNKIDCQKTSKKYSQDKWLSKPENQNYFKGSQNVERMQAWRKDHPGYWKRSSVKTREKSVSEPEIPLQDVCVPQQTENKELVTIKDIYALQDVLNAQQLEFEGLVAHLIGQPLQEVIEPFIKNCYNTGRIMRKSSVQKQHDQQKEASYEKTTHLSTPGETTAISVQLDRPSSDP